MKELKQLWVQLPHKPLIGAVAAAWLALFHLLGNSSFGYVKSASLFGWLTGWYELAEAAESDDVLCPYVPLAVLGLIYVKRRELAQVMGMGWPTALLGVLLGLGFHVLGFLMQQARISAFGFLVGTYALMGVFWGWAWLKAIFFPYFLLLFAIPWAAYTDPFTFHLRLFSTNVSTWVCAKILGLHIVSVGTSVFRTPGPDGLGFQFEVAPACSGIRSLLMVVLVTLTFSFLNFTRGRDRLVLWLAAVPLAVAGNIVRLIVVFTVGDAFGHDAGKMVETKFGFITYVAALMGVLLLGRWLQRRDPMRATRPLVAEGSSE